MKELSRRVSGNKDDAADFYEVDAEIVVEDDSRTIYLHAYFLEDWDDIPFRALTKSIYDVSLEIRKIDMYDTEAINAALEKRENIIAEAELQGIDIYARYASQYRDLLQMIQTQIDGDRMPFSVYEK